jgi:hypothetical protein
MSQSNIWNRINNRETIDDLPKIYKFMKRKCLNWNDCLYLAREKFDKYFSNKVIQFFSYYYSEFLSII